MGTARIVFASDLAPIRKFAAVMKNTPAAVYGDLLPRFEKADSITRFICHLDTKIDIFFFFNNLSELFGIFCHAIGNGFTTGVPEING